jgi:D-glycero-alpha-D-manno-heptose-7-phosphate kinase
MIISKTPLRISLLGGGTDFSEFYKNNGGMVISCSINKYIYVIVKERFDDLIVLNYTDHEIVKSVDEIKHEIIRECLKYVGIERSIEISTLADISSHGSGLGSSSSVTVGILNALYGFLGKSMTSDLLAQIACKIEIEILKKPIGKQDQYIAAFGGFKKIVFNNDESVDVIGYSFSEQFLLEIGSNLLLHFTNISRKSELILTEQKNNIHSKKNELNEIKSLAQSFDSALQKGDFGKLGIFLKQNWLIKKKLASRITSDDIENMIALALRNGSTGCKIAGAGGGGFLLNYVDRDEQNRFRIAMKNYREMPFMIDKFGSRIIFNIS